MPHVTHRSIMPSIGEPYLLKKAEVVRELLRKFPLSFLGKHEHPIILVKEEKQQKKNKKNKQNMELNYAISSIRSFLHKEFVSVHFL